jgi:hypothetical protein
MGLLKCNYIDVFKRIYDIISSINLYRGNNENIFAIFRIT